MNEVGGKDHEIIILLCKVCQRSYKFDVATETFWKLEPIAGESEKIIEGVAEDGGACATLQRYVDVSLITSIERCQSFNIIANHLNVRV